MSQVNQTENDLNKKSDDDKSDNPLESKSSPQVAPQKKEDSLSLGKYLEQKRIEIGFSIKQISIETKISERILENLEKENFQSLPKKVYLKGFIKNYCKVLKVSDQQAQSLLEKNFHQNLTTPNIEGRFSNHDETESSKNKLFIGAAFLAIVFGSYGIYQALTKTPEKEGQVKIKTVTLSSDTPLHAPSNETIISENELDQSVISVKKDEPVEKEPEDNKELEDSTITFKPFPNSNYKVDSSKDSDFINDNFSETLLYEKSNFSERIIVKATGGETWLAYQKKESGEVIQKILKDDQELMILSNEASLVLGNSNVVTLYHNDRILKVASSNGIRSLVFPKSASKNYKLPLFYYNEGKQFVSSKAVKKD
jgi:cytoskeleton protein RodZ